MKMYSCIVTTCKSRTKTAESFYNTTHSFYKERLSICETMNKDWVCVRVSICALHKNWVFLNNLSWINLKKLYSFLTYFWKLIANVLNIFQCFVSLKININLILWNTKLHIRLTINQMITRYLISWNSKNIYLLLLATCGWHR